MAFGRLERPRGDAPMSDINVTPLVDVMLVLLVIFIITAPLLASSIRLDLPRTDVARPGEAPRFVTLVIDAAGKTYLNDAAMTVEEMASRLSQAAAANPDTEVQLRADTTVPYGRVVEVMGAAQKAGLSRIAFVSEPGARPAPAGGEVARPAAR